MHLSVLWRVCIASLGLAFSAAAQSAPEQLCGRDILTIGDAWENVQVERYEFERILSSGSLVVWPQRMAALVSHLRFMERRAQLSLAQRDRIAIGVQLVAGRTLPSNQLALSGDAVGLRAELAQIEAGIALVGEQFPEEQLKPLVPLTHLLAATPPQLHATLVNKTEASHVTYKLTKESDEILRISKCDAFLVAADGGDFHHIKAQETGKTGEFSAVFKPSGAGPHRLWIAATQDQKGREELLSIDFAQPSVTKPALTDETLVINRADIKAELRFIGASPRADEITVARLILTRSDRQPMKSLERISGEMAHLIAFTNGAQEAIPIRHTGSAAQPEFPGSTEIDFRFRPRVAGNCHLFAEIRINGTNETLNFSFPVRAMR